MTREEKLDAAVRATVPPQVLRRIASYAEHSARIRRADIFRVAEDAFWLFPDYLAAIREEFAKP